MKNIKKEIIKNIWAISSGVEQLTLNQCVVGSIPTSPSIYSYE